MAAVLGLDREKLQQACGGAAELGVVQITGAWSNTWANRGNSS